MLIFTWVRMSFSVKLHLYRVCDRDQSFKISTDYSNKFYRYSSIIMPVLEKLCTIIILSIYKKYKCTRSIFHKVMVIIRIIFKLNYRSMNDHVR